MTSNDVKKAAKDIGDDVGDRAGAAVDKAAEIAGSVRDSASDFASRAGDTASGIYDKAHARDRDAADRLPDSASDALAAGQRAYSSGSDRVARQVSKQPIEALLLAAAIGYLVGWATNRS